MGFLIDTNIWTFLQRRTYAHLNAKFATLAPESVYLSPIVRGELEVGYLKGDRAPIRRAALDQIILHSRHLSIDHGVAITYAALRTKLELAGIPIGRNDTWIAAEALHHNLVVVTHNVDEFSRVKGLKVEDWTQE